VHNKIIHTIPSWTNLDASTPFRNSEWILKWLQCTVCHTNCRYLVGFS